MRRTVLTPGQVFGRLTVITEVEPIPAKEPKRRFLVRCTCGVEKTVNLGHLTTGKTVSCGCIQKEIVASQNLIHGCARKNRRLREHNIWIGMRSRCYNPRNPAYQRYGGRGIEVCDRWDSFESFLYDMGTPPSKSHSIDRIDNDGDYCPENCRWATYTEQAANTRKSIYVLVEGRKVCVSEAMRMTSLGRKMVLRKFPRVTKAMSFSQG